MTSTTAYFLLDRFAPESWPAILADDQILKLSQGERRDFRHGMTAGPRGFIFDSGLQNQQHNPCPTDQVKSICVASDHPAWAWFLLHLDSRGLT